MGLYDLVIFDSDGVLVDSEGIANRALAETLTASGLPTSEELAFREYRGRILADVMTRINERNGGPLDDSWVERFESLRAEYFKQELKEIPGVRDLILALKKAGIDLAVGTQGKPDKTALTLGLTGLRELFADDAVFTSYEVQRGKPYPDLYLWAARSRGFPPERCAVIEDTEIGVRAGVAAGMTVFGYASETPAEQLAAAGAEPFAHFDELHERLIASQHEPPKQASS